MREYLCSIDSRGGLRFHLPRPPPDPYEGEQRTHMSTTTTSEALPTPELNATPLIDVMLVLLTMLILTVPVINHAVKLDMPVGRSTSTRSAVDLDIDSDGRVFWNGTNVADDQQLEAWFRGLAQQSPQPD